MKQGKNFRIPEGRSDLQRLWQEAQPLEATNLPVWVWPAYASTYRCLGFIPCGGLRPDEQESLSAELGELEAAGLIIVADDDRCGHHVYITAPHLPFFVDEKRNLSINQEATTKLASRNDSHFLRGRQGVVEVDTERWREAQCYERRSWLAGDGLNAREDRNSIHEKYFENYVAIEDSDFENAIEIGCGPFTNMARILKYVRCEKVTLLDPLISDYMTHPFCTYKDRRLRGSPVRTVAKPIESFSTKDTFDLVVMINVLEHCFSAPKAFEHLLALTARAGILVFHDKLIPPSEVEDLVHTSYDAGHPLRVSEEIIVNFLSSNYEELYNGRIVIPGEVHTFDAAYFIGRKRVGSA